MTTRVTKRPLKILTGIRLDPALLKRIDALRKEEERARGYRIPTSEILRGLIDVGLERAGK